MYVIFKPNLDNIKNITAILKGIQISLKINLINLIKIEKVIFDKIKLSNFIPSTVNALNIFVWSLLSLSLKIFEFLINKNKLGIAIKDAIPHRLNINFTIVIISDQSAVIK